MGSTKITTKCFSGISLPFAPTHKVSEQIRSACRLIVVCIVQVCNRCGHREQITIPFLLPLASLSSVSTILPFPPIGGQFSKNILVVW